MKERSSFILLTSFGICLIVIGLMTKIDYYSTLIFATGCGFVSGAAASIIRSIYWNRPKRKEEYLKKKYEAHIDSVDERNQFLRMRAGYITYQLMTLVILRLSFILALFRVDSWIIGMIFLLFILQWLIGTLVYHISEKRI